MKMNLLIKEGCIKFKGCYNGPLTDDLINQLKELLLITDKLQFPYNFNNSIDPLSEIDGLTHICFGKYFNKSIDNLPNCIESIVLDTKFNLDIAKFPANLKSIEFGYNFNKKCEFPDTLTSIKFGASFNCIIDRLPVNLEVLEFGMKYDKPLCALPNTLKKLVLGYYFNHPIYDYPASLRSICYGFYYNFQLNNLPNDLEEIVFK